MVRRGSRVQSSVTAPEFIHMAKKLYRSRSDKMIAGVCGGLADYSGIDVTIWRIIFVLIALPGGVSVLVYFILWLLMPLESKQK